MEVRTDIETGDLNHREIAMVARELMRAVLLQNCFLFRALGIPPLYRSGVLYGKEPWAPSYERFDNCKVVFGRKWGDCDDLAPYRAAELRVYGDPRMGLGPCKPLKSGRCAHGTFVASGSGEILPCCANVRIYCRPGSGVFHCETRLPDGSVEDPSRFLGMKSFTMPSDTRMVET